MRCSWAATRSSSGSLPTFTRPWAFRSFAMTSRGRPPRNGSWSPTAWYSGLVRAFSDAGGPGMRQRPEHVPRHDEIEAAGRERQLLGVALLEPDRGRTLGRLAARLGD